MDWVDAYPNVMQALEQLHERHKREPSTRRWKREFCERLAQDGRFKATVYSLREALDVSPELRRRFERSHSNEAAGSFKSAEVFQSFVAGIIGLQLQQMHSSTIRSAVDDLEATLGFLPPELLLMALVTDFDGDEFMLFSAVAHAPPLVYASVGKRSDTGFRRWRNATFKPNRVYLDVTLNSLDDVAWVWPWVEDAQRTLGVPPSRRGRLEGEPRQKAVLAGSTWSDLREAVRAERSLLPRLEREYVDERKRTEENRLGRSLSRLEKAGLRRRSLDNFRKQVTHHPDLRDLNFRHRKPGRPVQAAYRSRLNPRV